ncbi:PREDICTED: serine--tRNA ligase, mitochondrial-like [Rhagoletis zephyria]|uniref:serine--tRNA ligase, mitochondrial-like n=1 Tax=Rhagoletis zephyria TaxID=28612 RepID=UPI0008117407|nr:PREDICTED: serine--tRNA ligase, mitochondrial-like [Rhagoletis zephyria]XP_017463306.1 PREDICTED: serine--tRNA ligase, mitochondrial-like [Rhagoletis zephyria]
MGTLRHLLSQPRLLGCLEVFNAKLCGRNNNVGLRQLATSILDLNWEYLKIAEENILLRKHCNNVPLIRSLLGELHKHPEDRSIKKKIEIEIAKLPNNTHSRLMKYGDEPCEIYVELSRFPKAEEFSVVCKYLNFLRTEHLGHYNGHKSYYLMGDLAGLEQALIRYTIKYIKKKDFRLISVPDILPKYIINGCGMHTDGDRTQVYKIITGECLSGTSEMALAGLFSGEIFNQEILPIKVAAVSRCFRAETSGLNEEKGIYRYYKILRIFGTTEEYSPLR